ncbi:hypothetical protein DFJ58DRAFT_729323 [Suillus subalutaceus]|uniref:uncharacterized protein n=1 Tax=Suillus subalutaceus TaxID=48586 RepID=UPI001B869CC0|nr:uncharacterized protein DFJ58DRAFT_729323 [Suillus subalutaceus]KAG1850230.1 hypothetical protein DFJ58DRAFT_729323 [Suillus subalutaceus]
MDTLNLTKKCPNPGHKDAASKDEKMNVKRPKLEATDAELMFPLPPFRQTPGPISVSQSYLHRLIVERWEAEVNACEQAKKQQLSEIAPGPNISILQASLRRIVGKRWDAELKRSEPNF